MSSTFQIALLYSEKASLPGVEYARWVKALEAYLALFLRQMIGREFHLHRVNEANMDSFMRDLSRYQAMIGVLVPSLAPDHALVRAMTQFAQLRQGQNKLMVQGHYCFAKVLLTPLQQNHLLADYAHLLPYNFYDIDVLTNTPRTFQPGAGSATERNYLLKLSDLAQNLAYLHTYSKEKDVSAAPYNRTIYIASVGRDMSMYRDALRRELIKRDCRILPDHALPANLKEREAELRRDLAQCVMSIHLIGEDHGVLIPGDKQSVVAFENRIAHAHTLEVLARQKKDQTQKPFYRMIWLSPDVETVTEFQQIFIENLKSEAATIEEAEVMEVPLEEFKYIVREKIARSIVPSFMNVEAIGGTEDSGQAVYLMYDKRDAGAVTPLATVLIDAGLEVLSLPQEGTPAELRYEHEENLRRCDASLIYAKEASDQWISTKLQDLFKAPAFGRKKAFLTRGVFFQRKTDFNIAELRRHMLVFSDPTISAALIRPFIEKIKP